VSHSHPDPALLVAYLDGTLFHRDTAAVDKHLETCTDCAALLASMREKRRVEQEASAARTRRLTSAAIASVVLVAFGLWLLWPRSAEPVRETEAVRQTGPVGDSEPARSEPWPASPVSGDARNASPAAAAPRTASPAGSDTRTGSPASAPASAATAPAASAPAAKTPAAPASAAKAPAPAAATSAPPKQEPPARRAAASPAPRPDPAPRTRAEARRQRQQTAAARPPRVMWRTRDQSVESSTDGGTTWTTVHTADRPIRAGAFVSEDVAWVVGDNGLILRRTANGWFGSTSPAEGNITAVTATSPSRATVTLEDGRVFTTGNGGVTWTSVEPGAKATGTESPQRPRRTRRRAR